MRKLGRSGEAGAREPAAARASTTHVALLRGINVGGRRPVAMADLRELASRLGFAHARTLLQSGNLVFECAPQPTGRLAKLLQAEARGRLGVDTDFFVRTAAEWKTLVAANPFPAEARRDPARLAVLLLRDAPEPAQVRALQAAISGCEVFRCEGRQAYVFYPDGMGRSRLTSGLIERKLGTRATGRNWNTVLKLAAAAGV